MSHGWRRVAVPYGRWRIRRALDGLHVHGLDHARAALAAGPVTFAATHVAWWDGVLMVVLDDVLNAESRFLMDAANLGRLPFLKAIGAIGLDRSSPVSPRRGIRAARKHLTGPGNAVWMFPQGRQRPRHRRPLGLRPGVESLHRDRPGLIVPVTLGYGFRESPLPAAVVTFEPPLEPGFTRSMLEHAMLAGIARADDFLDGEVDGFETVIASRQSSNSAGLGSRLLAWVSRG